MYTSTSVYRNRVSTLKRSTMDQRGTMCKTMKTGPYPSVWPKPFREEQRLHGGNRSRDAGVPLQARTDGDGGALPTPTLIAQSSSLPQARGLSYSDAVRNPCGSRLGEKREEIIRAAVEENWGKTGARVWLRRCRREARTDLPGVHPLIRTPSSTARRHRERLLPVAFSAAAAAAAGTRKGGQRAR